MSKAKKLAEEIVNVLKFNPQLTDEEKILSIETRLTYLIRDVETACAEAHRRTHDGAVIVDTRPQDIPQIRDLMLASQQNRGPLN